MPNENHSIRQLQKRGQFNRTRSLTQLSNLPDIFIIIVVVAVLLLKKFFMNDKTMTNDFNKDSSK